MISIKTPHTIEELVKKSRFIALLIPCTNETAVADELKKLHNVYPDASHIVYAYRIKTTQGLIYRFHDAGEPTGTAGKPIFQQLDGKELVNVLLVVVRYFGGVKLGAGGLTRAYGNAAKHVIDAADTAPYVEWSTLTLTLAYNQLQALEYQLKKLDGRIVEQSFTEQIRLVVELPQENTPALRQDFPESY